jgi:hypothetical protein
MTRGSCPRLFEAEALRDGRLAGAERLSFDRHVSACRVCAREVEALAALAQSVRARETADFDELHRRRERTRLLVAFERGLVTPERGLSARRSARWAGAFAAVALVCGALVLSRLTPASRLLRAHRALVHGSRDAVWSRRDGSERETIALERGTLSIQVDHGSGGRGLLVALPDGELEDIGTTFSVCAIDGHTARVAVRVGNVVLRIRGQAAVTIAAGGSWVPSSARPAPMPTSTPTSALAPSPPARERVEPATKPHPTPRAAARDRTAPRPPRTAAVRASARPASVPADDFRAATTALDAGMHREAAAAFATFLLKHPDDARAEDAAYLRVIALQRCGNSATMQDAARAYLGRYPSGFRRAEINKLLGVMDERGKGRD